MKALMLAAALFIAGCAQLEGVGERDPFKETVAACNTITSALNIITPNMARLNENQLVIVDKVVDISEPICAQPEPPETASALVSDLAAQIVSVQVSLVEGS